MGLLLRAALGAALTFAATGRAEPTPPAAPVGALATAAALPRLDVKRAKLDNGLRVVLLVDHTTPTVAIDVAYDVGARNEERGRTGLAQLLERLMFQGSRNVPRGEHRRLVSGHGGQLDGTSTPDQTSYRDLLPSSELGLGLWLEADRMKSLDVSSADVDMQRTVLKEEARREDAAQPLGTVRLSELVFQGYWPYEHPAGGPERDLDAAPLASVRGFHDAYYAPNNAIVTIAGDFEEGEALTLVKRYFGDARAQPALPRYAPPPVPEQSAPRSSVVEDARARLPAVLSGWMIPGDLDAEHYPLELAAVLLGDGESSRLHRALVRERAVGDEVRVAMSHHRGPDLFAIDVKLASGARAEQVTRLVDAQLKDVASLGPTDEEMKKLRSRLRSSLLFGLESNLDRARKLATVEMVRGDASLVNAELERYLAVTRDDISRAVARYLTPSRRNTVDVKPGEKK